MQTEEEVFQSDIVSSIFSALTEAASSRHFIDFLFRELLESNLNLNKVASTLAERQVVTQQRKNFEAEQMKLSEQIEVSDLITYSKVMASTFEQKRECQERVAVRREIGKIVSLLWSEFFLCEPENAKMSSDSVARECPCRRCFSDHSEDSGCVNPSAKCQLIPNEIRKFCQTINDAIGAKFPRATGSVICKFIFDKWLMNELCNNGNKNGLVTDHFIRQNLYKNLQLLKDAICILNSPDRQFIISVHLLPKEISAVCLGLRHQAKRFALNFLSPVVDGQHGAASFNRACDSEPDSHPARIETVMVSWTSLALIFDFMKQRASQEEAEEVKREAGQAGEFSLDRIPAYLRRFLRDEDQENSPALIRSKKEPVIRTKSDFLRLRSACFAIQ